MNELIKVKCPICHSVHRYGVMPWNLQEGRMIVPSYCRDRSKRRLYKIDLRQCIVIAVYGGMRCG